MAKKPDRRSKPPPRREKPGLTRDDADLFHAAMADVKSVPGAAPSPPTAAPTDVPPPAAPPRTVPQPGTQPPRARPAAATAARLPELGAGLAAGLDTRTMDRLRRGRIRPEGRLDLHGLVQTEAYGELTGFIARAAAAGKRCVVVITGKGRISEGGGVLRRQLPGWLNGPGVRPHIIGFAEAQPKDGGAGAMYVLLRRRRS